MFESDDFDQILSQFELPEVVPTSKSTEEINKNDTSESILLSLVIEKNSSKFETLNVIPQSSPVKNNKNINTDNETPTKCTKRKIINSYFDHKTKRKFPGPAGILTSKPEETKDDSICQIELLSQDIDLTQNIIQRESFECPLWRRLQSDIKDWNIHNIDSIKEIKQHSTVGNLRRRKAQSVAAFVEAVDRSVIDPLIILRDTTGSISCTLHRDVWSKFSPYIVSEPCALVLWKPTVLITGGTFKKHYLNITQSNILGIYSSALHNDVKKNEDLIIPDGYIVDCTDHFTVIKVKTIPRNTEDPNRELNSTDFGDMFDDLDKIFLDEMF